MAAIALYSEEQITRASEINLVDYLYHRGERLKKAGSSYRYLYRDGAGEHDSVTVYENRWYDHKNQYGGYPIQFLQRFYNMTFKEAVADLLDGEQPNQQKTREPIQAKKSIQAGEHPAFFVSEKKEFKLPEPAQNMKKLFAYLVKTRFIDQKIVQHFVHEKAMCQEKEHGNIVFLGLDENGVPHSATKKGTMTNNSYRGTVSGSDTRYGFCHRGTNAILYVFEAPIDLLSFLTIYPENWQENNYIALDGLSSKAMLFFLEQNPQIQKIAICVDYDAAGIEAAGKFQDLLIEKGYEKENIKRLYPVFKDWNEMLKAEAGLKPLPAQRHPKIKSYKNMVCALASIADNDSFVTRFQERFMQQGIRGISYSLKPSFDKLVRNTGVLETGKLHGETRSAVLRLLYLANTCLLTVCEIETSEMKTKENGGTNMALAYKKVLKDLFYSYRPYQDKGIGKGRWTELQRLFGNLNQDGISVKTFKCLADQCIKMAVYLETTKEQDMELAQRNTAEEPCQEDSACQDNTICQLSY